ncbi:FAD-dependent monooxygenase [Cryptosporangium phraense]|uniref:FAD-dependent monooxygenase n=1 Tax=Cryptosporangium phraense TaxID=2593070 RepID=UPI001F11779F
MTVVERAAALRDSGYAVDFRGDAVSVLAELGILDEVRGHRTGMRGTTLVDDDGVAVDQWGPDVFGGDLEVPKRALTAILHRLTADTVTYIFGDTITALRQQESGVAVEFAHRPPSKFDLVVGADGMYSAVRALAFGPHERFLRHLGMSGAGFSTANFLGLDHTGLLQPSGTTAVYLFGGDPDDRLTVSLSFATESPELDRRDRRAQEDAVRSAFAGRGWEIPRLLDAMSRADDYYFASTGQVEVDQWHRGRVVLVGDAGYCAAPTSGSGTSQALIGARTLARALAGSGYEDAFTAYERQLRPFVAQNQAAGRAAASMFGGGTVGAP